MLLAQSTNAILPKFSEELSEVIYGEHEALAENFRIFNRRMLEIQGILEHRNQERQAQNDIPYPQHGARVRRVQCCSLMCNGGRKVSYVLRFSTRQAWNRKGHISAVCVVQQQPDLT